METDRLEEITRELVCRDFEIEEKTGVLLELLAARIGDLLKNNPVLLKSIFYRIDLNESKLGMALVSLRDEELHLELAVQVVERLRKKAETRLKYS